MTTEQRQAIIDHNARYINAMNTIWVLRKCRFALDMKMRLHEVPFERLSVKQREAIQNMMGGK